MKNWEEIRRAVEYVRYHEQDAQALAPHLHRRGSRRSNAQEDVAPEPVPVTPTES